jgi:hypothetical protein
MWRCIHIKATTARIPSTTTMIREKRSDLSAAARACWTKAFSAFVFSELGCWDSGIMLSGAPQPMAGAVCLKQSVAVGLAPKKRGRPRKERPEEAPEFWKKQLHNHRLGEHGGESKQEVLACFFVNKKTGRGVSLEKIGTHESVTQQTDEIASLHPCTAACKDPALSPR